MKWLRFYIPIVLATMVLFCLCGSRKSLDQQLQDFFAKEDVTILVTDSGLGGLSVAADVAKRLPGSGVFKHARIVFFNSLFHNESGYNSLDSEAEKVRIFNTALEAMKKKYQPDLLLIACNTLSVIYDKTPFSRKAPFPVIGIVETGVDAIAEHFDQNPDAVALIFATKTTIGSDAHKTALVRRGYPAGRIVGQACHRLAGAVERGYDSQETDSLVQIFVSEALDQIEDSDKSIFASFNCTHYGYSADVFQQAFAQAGYPDITLIDPNPRMADFMFESEFMNRYTKTNVTVEVVSKTTISDERGRSLSSLLEYTSPETAKSLRDYQYKPDLFDAKFDTTLINR